MTQNNPSSDITAWQKRLKNSYAVHNVIALRPEMPVYLIIWDRTKEGKASLEWIDLGQPNNTMLRPQHFEAYFGKSNIRDQHYFKALKKADATNKVVVPKIYGTYDLFQPLEDDGTNKRAFIHAGHFLLEQPNWKTIASSWKALSGQHAASANRDFVDYVKMILDLPIVPAPMLKALKEFFELYATYIFHGYEDVEIRNRIDEINTKYYTRYWPINDWITSIISSNKFLPPPWQFEGKLTDWMKVGIGIEHLPTTAITIMPLDAQKDVLDPVKTLLRNAKIQRDCINFAKDLPETAATPLQDYGISLITSTKAKSEASRAQSRLELRDTAQKFRRFIRKKFNVNAIVGIGHSVPSGQSLHSSHESAVLALHMCVQMGQNILFYDEHVGADKFKYAQLQQAADELMDALSRESSTTLKLASDRYVHLVLKYSNQRIETVRGQFLANLFQMFATVQRRNPMRQEARNNFIDDLATQVEDSRSMEQLIESFNEALQRLSFITTKAWRGPSVMLLEATLQYLRENYFEPLHLPDVAKKAGFSVPVFTRVFKQATGTSYLDFLRNVRIEHAKKLLSSTLMTLEQIAQACGFNSQHHLIRSFKKVTNETPGTYRKNNSTMSFE
ncbi:MAG: helix-turn-helix transcriptional regulator [Deltaproteobacteria bacterium]|nr:helix-turn-helix transcriptional regulator [Deltaproteobacteria bacterium]